MRRGPVSSDSLSLSVAKDKGTIESGPAHFCHAEGGQGLSLWTMGIRHVATEGSQRARTLPSPPGHSRARGNPVDRPVPAERPVWIPACAGMTPWMLADWGLVAVDPDLIL